MASFGAPFPPPASKRRFDPRVVALCIALAVVLVAGVAVALGRQDDSDDKKVASRTPTSVATTTTSSGAPAGATTTSPPATIPAALAPTLENIKAQVAEIRGLPWKAPLDLAVVPRAQFNRELRTVNDRDQREDRLQGDGDTYKLLKLIPRSMDYSKALDDLYEAAVVGFYDPKTKKLLVSTKSETELTPAERVTIAHEFLHALTDQHFAFGPRTDALDVADKGEELLGLIGLLEGDARLLEAQWQMKYMSARERQQITSGADLTAFYRMPKYLRDSLLFPYTSGQAFVVRLYEETNSWRLVNEAYADPPRSSEDILHLERYKQRRGWNPPPLPPLTDGTGCRAARSGALGEFNMIEVLDQHLAVTDAVTAVDGWNGDAFQVVRCGTALAMVERWEADNEPAAARLAEALVRWAREWSGGASPAADGRFSGNGGAGRVVRSGARVDLVLADDAPNAEKVAAAAGVR